MDRRVHATVGPEVTLLLALALLTDAIACDCAAGPFHVLPERDATGLPTSAIVVVRGFWTEPAAVTTALRDAGGAEVAVDVEDVVAGATFTRILRPRAPLAPLATYTVVSDAGAEHQESSFTTGSAADTTAPAGVTLGALETRHDPQSDCGPILYLYAPLTTGATEDVVYDIQADTTDAFAAPERLVDDWNAVQWGAGACSDTHPGLEFGETWCFRARTMDTSGNTSAWSPGSCVTVGGELEPGDTDPVDTDEVSRPDDTDGGHVSGGCGCDGGAAPTSWAGLVVGMAFARRSRARRRG